MNFFRRIELNIQYAWIVAGLLPLSCLASTAGPTPPAVQADPKDGARPTTASDINGKAAAQLGDKKTGHVRTDDANVQVWVDAKSNTYFCTTDSNRPSHTIAMSEINALRGKVLPARGKACH